MNNHYEVLGARSMLALGRGKVLNTLRRQLNKPTPDHVSLIGPRHIGKTLVLKRLCAEVNALGEGYLATIYIDLRHHTPATDDEFRRVFVESVYDVIALRRPELSSPTRDFDWLSTVLELIFIDGRRLLVVMDGMDAVLRQSGITRGLWDNLLSLARLHGLRLVTGSRRPLRELCASADSETSDFWEIFAQPIRLGAFDELDWPDVLAPLKSIRPFETTAKAAIIQWTGGVPLLVAQLLKHLSNGDNTTATVALVQTAAEQILSDGDLLEQLWSDCDVPIQKSIISLTKGSQPLANFPEEDRRSLVQRGFAAEHGKEFKGTCRLIEHFARAKEPAQSDLRRLFASTENYARNFRMVLELRLNQIPRTKLEPGFRSAVEKAVRELDPNVPEDCLVWLRGVAERAFVIVWKAETPGRKIPTDWFNKWKSSRETKLPESESVPDNDLSQQCNLLRLATGTQRAPRVTRYVTKPTYILINTLKEAGDFGQHIETSATLFSAAAVFCMAAVELLARLHDELP